MAISAPQTNLTRRDARTEGIWFGPERRPLAGWMTRPPGAFPHSAVLIAPPTGYAYWCAHRPLRLLAERLAAAGHAVLRFDYDGTGDSAGDQWEPDRVDAWRAGLGHAAEALRGAGAESLTVLGVRLGATLALLDGESLGADRIVAWLPVARGRRYGRELRLLASEVPESGPQPGHRPTLVVAGSVFSDDTVREIGGLTLSDLTAAPARAVLVVDDPVETAAASVEALERVGSDVTHLVDPAAEDAVETPPEHADTPSGLLDRIGDWIGAAPASPAGDAAADDDHGPVGSPAAEFSWRGGRIRETFLRLGPERRAAVITEPVARSGDPDATLLVLLNPGSETHVGPGRAWVEYARGLALAGRSTVRVDFVGWGESPDGPDAPGRPYDAACVPDALAIVDALRGLGHRRVALGGLCASAWIALAAARAGGLDGVVAINPQLYWQPGDPVEIDWDLIRSRRRDEIERIERGARAHLWDALDALHLRGRAGRWLDELAAGPTRAELLFSERDDGLVFLERRHGRRLRRLRDRLGVRELTGIDHPMHRAWLREDMVAALRQALERIDATGTPRRARPGVVQARPSTQRGRDQICQRSTSVNPSRR